MDKNILGEKIKILRTGKGYSQDHLSNLAQISLRTVQRIENGETEARGDTLNRLALALGIPIDELAGTTIPRPNNGYIALMNLAGMGCLFLYFPFLGLVLPLTLWLIKKDRDPGINESGKRIVNFQLTYIIAFLIWLVVSIFSIRYFGRSFLGGLGAPEMILICISIFPFINALLVIVNTVRILLGKEIKYWAAYPFIK